MSGSWTENKILWRNFLGIVWGLRDVFTVHICSARAQIQSLKSSQIVHIWGMISVFGFCNVSLLTNIFCIFPVIFIEKATFKSTNKFIKNKTQYNDEKEIIDSNIDLLRKFQLRNIFLNI